MLIEKIQTNPEALAFTEVMQYIDTNYNFEPIAFTNGLLENAAGQNSGSCKLFQFAIINKLTKQQTLSCFAEHYQDVLNNPNGESHQNIRNFMQYGFEGLVFEKFTLNANL
jgi:hypothetical protein